VLSFSRCALYDFPFFSLGDDLDRILFHRFNSFFRCFFCFAVESEVASISFSVRPFFFFFYDV
jgi:hypothetical protein